MANTSQIYIIYGWERLKNDTDNLPKKFNI